MALDKLVDSTQLDADLTSVANAIRTKGGTSASLAFPAGFVTAIGNIPSGFTIDDIANGSVPSGDIVITTDTIVNRAFYARTALTSVRTTDTTKVQREAFSGCTNLTSVQLDNVTTFPNTNLEFYGCSKITTFKAPRLTVLGNASLRGLSSLVNLVLPSCTDIRTNGCRDETNLEAVDILGGGNIDNNCFQNNAKLGTIILRASSMTVLLSISAFYTTPFDSGKAGGTIYIPKVLYDHLGDGSSSDYKAATNWSTVNGYGTITWAQIEGSQYESYYADGTPIQS